MWCKTTTFGGEIHQCLAPAKCLGFSKFTKFTKFTKFLVFWSRLWAPRHQTERWRRPEGPPFHAGGLAEASPFHAGGPQAGLSRGRTPPDPSTPSEFSSPPCTKCHLFWCFGQEGAPGRLGRPVAGWSEGWLAYPDGMG